ncbi:MAG: hypothetical protein DHS80DRAFT_22176 [Piptocephalis tieghemiana]|nr:MAG: hypothetical protein DHS80DRAFT_22176 [Piptocephalis tieghemiana]
MQLFSHSLCIFLFLSFLLTLSWSVRAQNEAEAEDQPGSEAAPQQGEEDPTSSASESSPAILSLSESDPSSTSDPSTSSFVPDPTTYTLSGSGAMTDLAPETYTLSGTGPYNIPEPTGGPGDAKDTDLTAGPSDVTKKSFCRAIGNQDLFFQSTKDQQCPSGLIPMTDKMMIGCVDPTTYILQDPTKCPAAASVVNLNYVYCAQPSPTTKLCPPGQAAYFFPVGQSVSLGSKPPPIPEAGHGEGTGKDGSVAENTALSSSPSGSLTSTMETPSSSSPIYCHSTNPMILGIKKAENGAGGCGKGMVQVDTRKVMCMQNSFDPGSSPHVQNPLTGGTCLSDWSLVSLDDYRCYSSSSLVGKPPSVMGQCEGDSVLMLSNSTANDLLRQRLGLSGNGAQTGGNHTVSLYIPLNQMVPLAFQNTYCYSPGVSGVNGPYKSNYLCQDQKQSQVNAVDLFCRRADDPLTGGITLVPSYDDLTCDHGEKVVSIRDFICSSSSASSNSILTGDSNSIPNELGQCEGGGILVPSEKSVLINGVRQSLSNGLP